MGSYSQIQELTSPLPWLPIGTSIASFILIPLDFSISALDPQPEKLMLSQDKRLPISTIPDGSIDLSRVYYPTPLGLETPKVVALPQVNEQEVLDHPLFQVSGLFAIGEPGWADRHDQYLAKTYLEDHADEE